MLLPLLFLVGDTDPDAVYNGRAGRLDVHVPRLEAELKVDGVLDEPAWAQAVVLTGFSQFTPVDGVAAVDSTEVLVWYSATAIHFGVRAFEAHGAGARDARRPRQHRRGRQRADPAGHVRRRPPGLDVRGESVRRAGGRRTGRDGIHQRQRLQQRRGQAGGPRPEPRLRLRVEGPAHGLRLRGRGPDPVQEPPLPAGEGAALGDQRDAAGAALGRRGLVGTGQTGERVVPRSVGASGRAHRSQARARAGAQPVASRPRPRARRSPTAGRTRAAAPSSAARARWGITNNLNFNATANPDFSQVESDAGQFQFDPRNELFFSEKRPFFLDGKEQFNTPNSLIYTRRIVQPVAAVKLTGKGFGTDIGLLSAVDDPTVSPSGEDHPIYNLLRVQRDMGVQSRLGVVYTDKVVGSDYNRVAGADARLVFGEVYSVQLQPAASRTRAGALTATAPLWYARFLRNGRTFGLAPRRERERSRLPCPERLLPAARLLARERAATRDRVRSARKLPRERHG